MLPAIVRVGVSCGRRLSQACGRWVEVVAAARPEWRIQRERVLVIAGSGYGDERPGGASSLPVIALGPEFAAAAAAL